MPNPYKARVDVRRFLNLPGFHGGAFVVAYVEDTDTREITKRDSFGYEGSRYIDPQPRIILEIADCANRINLEFELDSELDVENSLHKVDALVAALTEFRAGLAEEARLYSEPAPEVERLNRSQPQRPRGARGHVGDGSGFFKRECPPLVRMAGGGGRAKAVASDCDMRHI